VVAVADAESDLSAHAAAGAVSLLIRQMRRIVGAVDVSCLGHDAAALARQAMEAAQQPLGFRRVRDQAEVVPEHDDRVEDTQRLVDVVDRAEAYIAHAAAPANLDGARRDVNADDLLATVLQVEADPSAAAPHVECPAADEAHRLSFHCGPTAEGCEVEARANGRVDEAVVPLDDLERDAALQRREEHLPVAVLTLLHAISDSTVGSPRRRGGRSSRQVQSCGSLSSRKRRKRVPWRSRFPCTLS
jgi:hypothetical protein